jgi:hypothetical protein
MGCLGDPLIAEQRVRNRELEKKIKEWNRHYREAIKVLLLGMANRQLCLCITTKITIN